MPITSIAPNKTRQFAGPMDLLQQHAMEVALFGDPFERYAEPNNSSWLATWKGMARMGNIHGITSRVVRSFTAEPRVDPDFNPYQYIKDHPELEDDWQIQFMVERGQFDNAFNIEQFDYEVAIGRQYLDDIDTFDKATSTQAWAVGVPQFFGDPTLLIPGTALAKLGLAAKGGTTLTKALKMAAVASAMGLAYEKTRNTLLPVTDTPGLSNELLVMGISAAIGSSLSLLTTSAGKGRMALPKRISTRKARQMSDDFQTMVQERSVRHVEDGTPPTDPNLQLVTMSEEFTFGTGRLNKMLKEEVGGDRTIAVLFREGDANWKLIQKLKKRYKKAGKTLIVDEGFADLTNFRILKDAEDLLNNPGLNREATIAELSGTRLNEAVSFMTRNYANVQAVFTTGGRLAQATMARIQDVYRTLSGSAQTVTAGQAQGRAGGASAENLKAILTKRNDETNIAVRRIYKTNKAPQGDEGRVTYQGKQVNTLAEFHEAIADLMRRQNAQHRGFQVDIEENIHPAIKQATVLQRDFYWMYANELEKAKLLAVGPRALQQAEKIAKEGEIKLAKMRDLFEDTERKKQIHDLSGTGKPVTDKRINTLRKKVLQQEDKLGKNIDDVGRMKKAVDNQQFYLGRLYDVERIMANPQGFVDDLAKSFRSADEIVDGVRVAPDERPLIPDVIDPEGRTPLTNIHKFIAEATEDVPFAEQIRTMTEGELPPDMRQVYRESLDVYYRNNATHVMKKLTDPHERHGVVDALIADGDPLMARVMDIDESQMNKWMVRNIEDINERYSQSMSGRTSIARSLTLNPEIWNGITLKNGNPIRTAKDIKAYLDEMVGALQSFAAIADEKFRPGAKHGRLSDTVKKIKRSVEVDMYKPLDALEGRSPLGGDREATAAFSYFSRVTRRLQFANKLGSVAWAQMNDAAPMFMYMMQRPQTIKLIPQTVLGLNKLSKRDQQMFLLFAESEARVSRIHKIADVDGLPQSLGIREGRTKQVTAFAENAINKVGDWQAKWGMFNLITDVHKRMGGMLVIDRITVQARQLVKFEALVRGGMSEAAALHKVGLRPFEKARLAKFGFNVQRAKRWNQLTFERGYSIDNVRLRDAIVNKKTGKLTNRTVVDKNSRKMTFDDYMDTKNVVRNNFDDWQLTSKSDIDMFDTIASNINGEVNRSLVVTPGVFDQPIINFGEWGKLFNQFQTFGMAFVNQRLKVMAQMPVDYQLWYNMTYMFLGAMSDAVSSHLSGRRSLPETAELWQENPIGMMYAAWDRSGIAGTLSRPLAVADAAGLPFAPGQLFDQTPSSAASRHIQPGWNLTYFGPAASDADRAGNVLFDLLGGEADEDTIYSAWKLMPTQNFLWWRAGHTFFDLPIVPEHLIEDRFEGQEPKP